MLTKLFNILHKRSIPDCYAMQHLGFKIQVFSVTIAFVSVSKELICFLASYTQHVLSLPETD